MNDNTNSNVRKIRLGIDLDGVIYNFEDDFRSFVAKEKGIDPDSLPSPTEWDFHTDWGFTEEEYLRMVALGAIRGQLFKNGLPYEGAVDGMQQLRDIGGYEVVIITARQLSNNAEHMKRIHKNTVNWLDTNGVVYDELIIDNDKSRHNLDILIDDGLHNVNAINMAERIGFVFDRPWNQSAHFNRMDDWEDLVYQMRQIYDRMSEYYSQTAAA